MIYCSKNYQATHTSQWVVILCYNEIGVAPHSNSIITASPFGGFYFYLQTRTLVLLYRRGDCMYHGIDYKAMVERAKQLKHTIVEVTDLMNEEEIEIWNNMHEVKKGSLRLAFVLLLIKLDLDRQIVYSVYLNDDRIFIK